MRRTESSELPPAAPSAVGEGCIASVFGLSFLVPPELAAPFATLGAPVLPAAGAAALPDVRITSGTVPALQPDVVGDGFAWQVAPERFLMSVDGVARYLVREAGEIVIDRAPEADDDAVGVWLCGSVMGALLHQRGLLPLHGGTVTTDRGAVVLLGEPGAGKSTLITALAARGCGVLADDVSVVSLDASGAAGVQRGFPRVKLRPDSVRTVGRDWLPRSDMSPSTGKLLLDVQPDGPPAKPCLITEVWELAAAEVDGLRVRQLTGQAKVQMLLRNTYRSSFMVLQGRARATPHLQQCIAVARQAVFHRVTRPHRPFLLDELADLVIAGDRELPV